MIVPITPKNLKDAALVHSLSWRESHRTFCTPAFVASHTPVSQEQYLKTELARGKKGFMLVDGGRSVGIVTVWGSLIENLYVLPSDYRKGYGTQLLLFALAQCEARPTLWVLSNNERALRFYLGHGFAKTGAVKPLSGALFEIELAKVTHPFR